MKKLFFLCFMACLCTWASAQKVYFLYLQSDDQSPFYVRMGDKIHSSAAAGFLILPNLSDSTYTFGLGFAKSSNPESSFTVNINQNDKGFILKNFDDGLALFDFRDLSVVKANTASRDNTVYETKSDKFSSILSKAAADPSILKVPVAKKEEPVAQNSVPRETIAVKSEETKRAEKTAVDTVDSQPQPEAPAQTAQTQPQNPVTIAADSATIQPMAVDAHNDVQKTVSQDKKEVEPPVETIIKKDVAAPVTAAYKPSTISRYSESSTTEGFGLVYFDKKEDGVDTIRILIPAPKIKLAPSGSSTTSNEQPLKEKEEPALLGNESEVVAKSNVSQNEPLPETSSKAAKTQSVNTTACKSTASDKDFMKLRKKMAARETEDDMIDEARKDFRGRCYSVEQIRYLSTLFLTSASKYQFFDAAYLFVTDKSNFASLSSEIRDEHYSKRFKALIGE